MASTILNEHNYNDWDARCKFTKKPHKQLTYAPHSVDGWYLVPEVHHYRFSTCYNIDTGGETTPDKIAFPPEFMKILN